MNAHLKVQVKPDTIEEVRNLTHEMLNKNLVSLKDLRSYVGKCTSIASVIFTWTPFLRPLWAALNIEEVGAKSQAPPNCTCA